MARVKKAKPTLETLLYSTPEQRILKLLLDNPTTSFTPRVLTSKLKGVRGLGGADGLNQILKQLAELGIVQWVNNHRSVMLTDDDPIVRVFKTVSAIVDLEGIRVLAEPLSDRGILFGSRSNGKARSDSDYDIFVVSDQADEVRRVITSHPLGKQVELVIWSPEDYHDVEEKDPELGAKLDKGVVLWGQVW